jgi:hypothetical protein
MPVNKPEVTVLSGRAARLPQCPSNVVCLRVGGCGVTANQIAVCCALQRVLQHICGAVTHTGQRALLLAGEALVKWPQKAASGVVLLTIPIM